MTILTSLSRERGKNLPTFFMIGDLCQIVLENHAGIIQNQKWDSYQPSFLISCPLRPTASSGELLSPLHYWVRLRMRTGPGNGLVTKTKTPLSRGIIPDSHCPQVFLIPIFSIFISQFKDWVSTMPQILHWAHLEKLNRVQAMIFALDNVIA